MWSRPNIFFPASTAYILWYSPGPRDKIYACGVCACEKTIKKIFGCDHIYNYVVATAYIFFIVCSHPHIFCVILFARSARDKIYMRWATKIKKNMWSRPNIFFFTRQKNSSRKKKICGRSQIFFFYSCAHPHIFLVVLRSVRKRQNICVWFHVRHLCLFLTWRVKFLCGEERYIFVCAAGPKKFSS